MFSLLTSARRIAVLCVPLLGSSLAHAQDYPARPIRLIVGSSAGGGGDGVARVMAAKLTLTLKQQIYSNKCSFSCFNSWCNHDFGKPTGSKFLCLDG